MAITAVDPIVLMLEGQRAPYRGALLTLGRQQIDATKTQVARQATRVGYPLDVSALPSEVLGDEQFFSALGFDSTASLDASAYERATHVHDLNSPDIPAELQDRFDVVLDRGTSEHVFHIPNLLAACRRMVKPGGRVMHYVPSTNHVDHGMYMFSPTLFVDYYTANGFSVPRLWLVAQGWQRARPKVQVFDYQPGCLEVISHGGFDGRAYQIFCVAERPVGSTTSATPQQRRYTEAWSGSNGSAANARQMGPLRRSLKRALGVVRATVLGDTIWAAAVNPVKKRYYFRRALRPVISYQT